MSHTTNSLQDIHANSFWDTLSYLEHHEEDTSSDDFNTIDLTYCSSSRASIGFYYTTPFEAETDTGSDTEPSSDARNSQEATQLCWKAALGPISNGTAQQYSSIAHKITTGTPASVAIRLFQDNALAREDLSLFPTLSMDTPDPLHLFPEDFFPSLPEVSSIESESVLHLVSNGNVHQRPPQTNGALQMTTSSHVSTHILGKQRRKAILEACRSEPKSFQQLVAITGVGPANLVNRYLQPWVKDETLLILNPKWPYSNEKQRFTLGPRGEQTLAELFLPAPTTTQESKSNIILAACDQAPQTALQLETPTKLKAITLLQRYIPRLLDSKKLQTQYEDLPLRDPNQRFLTPACAERLALKRPAPQETIILEPNSKRRKIDSPTQGGPQ